jgi:hypothetical protein
MNSHNENPFETIESAHEFVKLLARAVREAKRELEANVERESASDKSRRLDAFRIALYSLGRLETHMHQSSRILNDLRILRRLLLAEREIKRKMTLSASEARRMKTLPLKVSRRTAYWIISIKPTAFLRNFRWSICSCHKPCRGPRWSSRASQLWSRNEPTAIKRECSIAKQAVRLATLDKSFLLGCKASWRVANYKTPLFSKDARSLESSKPFLCRSSISRTAKASLSSAG